MVIESIKLDQRPVIINAEENIIVIANGTSCFIRFVSKKAYFIRFIAF
jgi:hypothetical protein